VVSIVGIIALMLRTIPARQRRSVSLTANRRLL